MGWEQGEFEGPLSDCRLPAHHSHLPFLYGTQVSAFTGADIFVISDKMTLTSTEATYARTNNVPVVLTSHMRVCEDANAWVEPSQPYLNSQSLKPKVRFHRDTL